MMLNYLCNCFLLLIPILLLNWLCVPKLPLPYQKVFFWKDIPSYIKIIENSSRILISIFPFILKLEFKTTLQIAGLEIYMIGLIAYSLSWFILIRYPQSGWSKSIWGFAAPAYTPILWLTGIALIGIHPFLDIPYHFSLYIILSFIFVCSHIMHTYIIYTRTHY